MNHPAFTLLIGVLILTISRGEKWIFRSAAVLTPVAALCSIYTMPLEISFNLFKGVIIYEGSEHNKLIGAAFCLVLIAYNLYAISQDKKNELIVGALYASFSILSLFAGDFLSLFTGLELMMLSSTVIIFSRNSKDSIRSAKKYFLTHFISGSLILLGIIHIILRTKSLELVNVAALIGEPEYSNIIIMMMLLGSLINVAIVPFSGWMVNYYEDASATGFMYLITFTTKLSVIVILKLFAGLPSLKYLGAILISYGSIKAIFENNVLRLLCYLSLMAIGLMLMGASVGTEEARAAVICYLFIHILYKATLSICAASVIDNAGTTNYAELAKTNNKLIIFGTIIGTSMMIALPGSFAFQVKIAVSHLFQGEIFYLAPMIFSFAVSYLLPWKNCLSKEKKQTMLLGSYAKASLIFISTISAAAALCGEQLVALVMNYNPDSVSMFNIENSNIEIAKQIFIIFLGASLALLYPFKKIQTKSMNLIEVLGNIFCNLYRKFFSFGRESNSTEPWSFRNLEDQMLSKVSAAHNQKTAIFIIFIVFLVILSTFYLKVFF